MRIWNENGNFIFHKVCLEKKYMFKFLDYL